MKKLFKAQIVILIAIIFFTYSNIVFAASIEDKQKEQEKTQSDIKQTEKELENVQQEKKDTLSQVEDLENQIEDYQSQIDELDSKISDLQQKLDEEERKQKERQELLNERLVAVYENGEMSYLDVLLSSNSIMDFISGYYLLSEITKYDNELLNQIEQTKKSIESQKTELDTAKKTKEAKERALEVVKKEKQAKADELSEDEKELQKELEELKAHENSIEKEIEKMQKEYDNKNGGSSSGASAKLGSLNFGLPVKGNYTITARFDEAGTHWKKSHTGIDFAAPKGTPVYAIEDGQVFDIGQSSAYGNYVEIYHGNGVYTFYAHASKLIATKKQNVKKGDLIMLVGDTGNATGYHVHLELRVGGFKYEDCINPAPYLPI